ncbi:hypothetical protein [Microbacterium maritypicum]|uniref:hypothetical protein n=1 Tax=Microbacterium maritypicum TaxID=33918 RepID=UPI003A8E0073
MTTTTFHTITTAVHATEGREQINRENLGYRQEDLANLGRYGYILVSTVTVPEPDGVTRLIDTLMLVEQSE